MEMPGTLGSAKVILPENGPANGWPKINQGSHLTVKTFEDGRTELIWDDAALLKEVKDAILSYESGNPAETPTKKVRNGRSKKD